jgi:NAD(P)-dependent dehydrogenase (short-subunit alcohol dehydrogenase family)
MAKLAGKVAVITGASQGLGLAMARVYVQEGAAVVLSARRGEVLAEEVAKLEAEGGRAIAVTADVSKREDAFRTIAVALERFGRLDVLVNNAQTTRQEPVEAITEAAIELTFGSGLFGTLYHMQAAFPHLRERGGSVINYGTRQGIYGEPGDGIYGANKEAIRALSRSAAREWGQFGIRVNVINPAGLSPAAAKFSVENPERWQRYMADISLRRFGDPELDIAPVAVFLASDDSRYVTGQTLNVDGGQVML